MGVGGVGEAGGAGAGAGVGAGDDFRTCMPISYGFDKDWRGSSSWFRSNSTSMGTKVQPVGGHLAPKLPGMDL